MKDKRVRADGVFSVICGLILFPFWIIAIIYSDQSTFTDILMKVLGISFLGGIVLLFFVIGAKNIKLSKRNIRK